MKNINISWAVFIVGIFFSLNNIFAQSSPPLIVFGLIADTQYADCESGKTRFYRNSLGKLHESIDYFNNQKVQFTVNLGDIIDRDQKDLDSVLICLKHLNKKIFHTTGNHDYKGITDNKVLYKKLKMPSEYYSFMKKKWVFVFLNTNEIAAYSNVVGTAKEQELLRIQNQIKVNKEIQGARWNGGVSSRQLQWLDNLLKKSEKKNRNVLIFCHHPLYPRSQFTALNNMEILDVINRYNCVKAIFSGHHHSGAFGYFDHIPCNTVEGMIETPDKNSFGIVRIYKDRIELEGKERMTSRLFMLQP